MKLNIDFLIVLFLLSGCGTDKKEPVVQEYYAVETNYTNKYDGDRLLSSTLFEYEIQSGQKNTGSVEQHSYVYNEDRLIRKEEYRIKNGKPELTGLTNYGTNSEEQISFNGTDTVNYTYQEFDEMGRTVRRMEKSRISVPEFDFLVDNNLEEILSYNESGDLIFRSLTDKNSGKTTRTYNFNEEIPSDFKQDSDTEVVVYRTENKGDTTITKRYVNNELDTTLKTFTVDNCATELMYDALNNLLHVSKEWEEDDLIIETNELFEMNALDSIFRKDGLEIKSVLIDSESKTILSSQYDEHGNLLRTFRELYIYSQESYRVQ